ncbi:response regulator transcription factor [Legionella impletisoli]|uniref:DNA-binding response regulator n=1 Tax=Legionella impletisoli TaxID=343510 RepID=A0A917NC36_9GAMM|nr:response regulator transcription factor [Legionella impletisoli]GGI87817.1 DNA-binding response regulator [Legionella impletisoli]
MEKVFILVVEDNKKLASYLKDCLEEEGYRVAIESRGDKAAFRILREQPDLVVLDIMLPGMDGTQICHTVRHDYTGKILMLTAINDLQSEVDLLNLGADDYLSKPISEDRLSARIKALLRRPNLVHEEKVLSFGPLEININDQSVTFSKQKVSISPTEFALLALLAKNQGKVLSRDNICFTLYGREYDGVDRGIDLKISRLRKALSDEKGEKIKTLHGKGYIFITKAW